MANQFYISAGLPPNDNDPGASPNTFHISAGLVPDDTAAVVGNISKVDGVSFGSLGKFNGIAKANIGKINGVSA